MITLTIERAWQKANYTIGHFYANEERLGESLEDTDRGLDSRMPVGKINQIKIKGKTAIPTGTYRVILSVSPKFKNRPWAKKYKGLVPEVLGVKGFSSIRIHVGTKPSDTDGCPLVGKNTIVGQLTSSTAVYDKLMSEYLIPAWEKGEEIKLVVK